MIKGFEFSKVITWLLVALGFVSANALVTPDLFISVSIREAARVAALGIEDDEQEWFEFHADAFDEYADEFTRLFESYGYKLSKNGRSMIRREGEKSFRFVKKG